MIFIKISIYKNDDGKNFISYFNPINGRNWLFDPSENNDENLLLFADDSFMSTNQSWIRKTLWLIGFDQLAITEESLKDLDFNPVFPYVSFEIQMGFSKKNVLVFVYNNESERYWSCFGGHINSTSITEVIKSNPRLDIKELIFQWREVK